MSGGVKRPQVMEVHFKLDTPKTYDEALLRRSELIAEVDELQDTLSGLSPGSREATLRLLRVKRGLLRQLKEWLRKNDRVKMSEWMLLARAHKLLSRMVEVPSMHFEEIEALLDAIELVVPGQYLDKGEKK